MEAITLCLLLNKLHLFSVIYLLQQTVLTGSLPNTVIC